MGAMSASAAGVDAVPQCPDGHQGLRGLLDTEYAFAERARTSVRAAFLDYLADDSLVLQPGPLPGRPFYTAAKESNDTLEWYPAVADLAGSEDLGFTSGPWVYTVAGGGAQIHGHFLSIWKRDAGCHWRVEFDAGVSHAPAATAEAKLVAEQASPIKSQAPPATLVAADAAGQALKEFQDTVQQSGMPAGLRTYALISDFRLYVEGEAPMAVTPATAYFAKGWNLEGWREAARGRSADASLLYAVGEVTDTKKNSRHAYVQIWRYDPRIANWGLRVLLLTPLAPAKEKS
jgi:hypothetical protein